jgi:3-hydroxyacyl-[acyl-carrier-protein] dehydratase
MKMTNENSTEKTKKTLSIHEVLKHLPHRYPFLLIDRVLDYEVGKSLVAIKNVTINEPFFVGHFPQRPVMPGVLMIEALAQAAAVLAFLSTGSDPTGEEIYYFAAVDNARFKRIVEPGDQLRLEVEVIKVRGELMKVHAIASVEGEVACTADLMSIKK